MSGIVKIDDEVFTADDFIKILKLNGRFENLMEEFLRDKLAVHAARRSGITLSDDDLQERADQFRRVHGLHRAKEANEYFDVLGVTLEEFESFLADMLYHEKIMEQVGDDQAVEEYFQLNSPKFDSIDVSHIVMDSELKGSPEGTPLAGSGRDVPSHFKTYEGGTVEKSRPVVLYHASRNGCNARTPVSELERR